MDNYIKEALDAIKNKLPEREVEYQQVKKNNGVTRDGFIIRSKDTSIAPIFYLTDDEREELTPEEFADRITVRFSREMQSGIEFDVSDFSDVEWVRKRIMFDIVNRARNKQSNLANIPITDDLMITFKLSVADNAHIRVTNDHIKLWGITVEELLEDAKRNSVVLDKVMFRSLQDVIVDMMIEQMKESNPGMAITPLMVEQLKEQAQIGIDDVIYVLTTEHKSSAALLYPEILSGIKERMQDNLVILPSSIHEVLIMRERDALSMGLDTVRSMVREVNRDVVMQQDGGQDFLSDEILVYDGELRQIEETEQVIE